MYKPQKKVKAPARSKPTPLPKLSNKNLPAPQHERALNKSNLVLHRAIPAPDRGGAGDGNASDDETSRQDDEGEEEEDDEGPKDDRFYYTWDKFMRRSPAPKAPSRVATLDSDVEGRHKNLANSNESGLSTRENAATLFTDAAETCRRKVDAIVKECRRLNTKYYDPMFDLRYDDALVSLSGYVNDEIDDSVKNRGHGGIDDVKRVGDIFDNPQFFVNDPTANDVQQGRSGDCWFLSAITALSGSPKRIKDICVAQNEQVGVYGFCFYRDGEWISEVVDDRLCVRFNEDHEQYITTVYSDETDDWGCSELPKKLRKQILKGADALYFASCRSEGDADETWLPLLEKAYAKAHLSYQSIEGGWTGEGIEDLTGGINTWIETENILDRDRLWNELCEVNKQFLFGCSLNPSPLGEDDYKKDGVVRSHAYAVLTARSIQAKVKGKMEKVRLLKLRNPWGHEEWTGDWSDGSKQWTPETMTELEHTFGDDGIFWISFEDFMKTYQRIDRTRLFGPEWTVVQQWTTVPVPRSINYSDTHYLQQSFCVTINHDGPVIFFLCQPDDRYFDALKGRYTFQLHFKVHAAGHSDYLVRSMSQTASGRSCSAELDLEAGTYHVHVKLTPWRNDRAKTAAQIIRDSDKYGREKVLSVGRTYDLAHSRGRRREAEIAETKKQKLEDRVKRHDGSKVVRRIEKEGRRKEKLRKQRVLKKEKERAEAKEAREKAKAEQEEAKEKAKREEEEPEEPEEEAEAEEEEKAKGAIEEEDKQKEEERGETKEQSESSTGEPINGEPVDITKEATEAKQEEKAEGALTITVDAATEAPAAAAATTTDTASSPTQAGTQESRQPEVPEVPEASEATKASQASEATQTPDAPEAPKVPDAPPAPETPEAPDMPDVVVQNIFESGGGDSDTPEAYSENLSDIGSVCDEDFEWDSDIDGSVDADALGGGEEDETDDLDEDDAWFALATIGLRVYSKDEKVGVELVG